MQLGSLPVAVVQYTFTHKQYTERHKNFWTTQKIFGQHKNFWTTQKFLENTKNFWATQKFLAVELCLTVFCLYFITLFQTTQHGGTFENKNSFPNSTNNTNHSWEIGSKVCPKVVAIYEDNVCNGVLRPSLPPTPLLKKGVHRHHFGQHHYVFLSYNIFYNTKTKYINPGTCIVQRKKISTANNCS